MREVNKKSAPVCKAGAVAAPLARCCVIGSVYVISAFGTGWRFPRGNCVPAENAKSSREPPAPRLTRTGPLATSPAATITGDVVMAVASDPPAVSVVCVKIVGLGDRDSFLAYRRMSRAASSLAEAILA